MWYMWVRRKEIGTPRTGMDAERGFPLSVFFSARTGPFRPDRAEHPAKIPNAEGVNLAYVSRI